MKTKMNEQRKEIETRSIIMTLNANVAKLISPRKHLAALRALYRAEKALEEYDLVVKATRQVYGHYAVILVDGNAAPALKGESWHYTTRSGERIHHPSAYSCKGWSSMCYHPSTIRIEVGREWRIA